MKKISQREARRLQKELRELKELNRLRNSRYATGYPGGVHIRTLGITETSYTAFDVAQRLNHTLVAKVNSQSELLIYAVPTK